MTAGWKRYVEFGAGIVLTIGAVWVLMSHEEGREGDPVPGPHPLSVSAGRARPAPAPVWLRHNSRDRQEPVHERPVSVTLLGKIETSEGTRVVLEIEGEQVSLAEGESRFGVKVLEHTAEGAILEIRGRRQSVSLSAGEAR